MVAYEFYTSTYMGGSITAEEWPMMEARAAEQLARYKRIYTVTSPVGSVDAENMAICAMADTLYYFAVAQNGGMVTSSSIGSVSSSQSVQAVDISPKAQAREVYKAACLYLDIYRGVC